MRPATAVIDLGALRHNLRLARRRAAGAKVVAVVKANGYGHGAARLLEALGEADMLGVACIEEALALREAGARQPILLMEGVFEADELPLCARHGFEVAVHDATQVEMLERARLARPLAAWLKVNTGMNRLGVHPEEALGIHGRLRACAAVAPQLRLMTHFANAEEPGDPATREQIGRFAAVAGGLTVERSFCNSAGLLLWPEAHAEWVRPGVMLYGVSPLAGRSGADEGLRPVMTLGTRLIAVREVERGEAVGYAGTWRATADTRVGIAAMGYGDGYPRHAPSGTPVLVNGKPVALAGRVSMDMLAIDLTGQPDAQVGDPVALWGDGLPVETIAARAGTNAYELLCGVTGRVRVELRG
ncbi:MAG TPA: alanine racemase [Geminicoccaceae bacterium]|nr:alanine racemase [Geminicoccaceae bacterium]